MISLVINNKTYKIDESVYDELVKFSKRIEELENQLTEEHIKCNSLARNIHKALEDIEDLDGNNFDTTDDALIMYKYLKNISKTLKGEDNESN